MAAQQPFHPVIADVYSGGFRQRTVRGFLRDFFGLAFEMHLGSPGFNPGGGRGWLKLAFHSVTYQFFF